MAILKHLNQVKSKTLYLCQYCNVPVKQSKLIKCSIKKCKIKICKHCATFIDNVPFCPVCVLNIVRNKPVIILGNIHK